MSEKTRKQIIWQFVTVIQELSKAMVQIAILTSRPLNSDESQDALQSINKMARNVIDSSIKKLEMSDNVNIELN